MDNQTPSTSQPEANPPAAPVSEMPTEPMVETPKAEEPQTNEPKKASSKKMMVTIIAILVFVIGVAAAGYFGYSTSKSKSDKTAADLNKKIALLESNEHTLPSDAVKVSECIPNMGSHYLAKDGDKEYGPFLLVTKQNKVIGVEYMASSEMYTKIPNTDPPVEVVTKSSPMYGWKFDHAEVSHLPKGHEGLTHDHIDVHLYTVTPDQQKNACI